MQGRSISRGIADGELLISAEPISFLSGVDPNTGTVVEHGHPLEGQSIAGRVLAFPYGKGSTVGSYVIYALKQNGLAPAAIINTEAEPIIAGGAIIAGIPMVDRLPPEFSRLPPGTRLTVNGDTGEVAYDETV
jgi:predicted aconitase with swiveling domain